LKIQAIRRPSKYERRVRNSQNKISPRLINTLSSKNQESAVVEQEVAHRVNAHLHAIAQHQHQMRIASEQENQLKVQAMIESLETRLKKVPNKRLDPEALRAEQAVLKCYLDNSDRVLDCWKQVQEFKRLVESS
jgi:hypothetical protein